MNEKLRTIEDIVYLLSSSPLLLFCSRKRSVCVPYGTFLVSVHDFLDILQLHLILRSYGR